MKALLDKLRIKEVNPSVSWGADHWVTDPKGEELTSYNPTTNQPIAKVVQATESTYNQVVEAAQESFQSWRRKSVV